MWINANVELPSNSSSNVFNRSGRRSNLRRRRTQARRLPDLPDFTVWNSVHFARQQARGFFNLRLETFRSPTDISATGRGQESGLVRLDNVKMYTCFTIDSLLRRRYGGPYAPGEITSKGLVEVVYVKAIKSNF